MTCISSYTPLYSDSVLTFCHDGPGVALTVMPVLHIVHRAQLLDSTCELCQLQVAISIYVKELKDAPCEWVVLELRQGLKVTQGYAICSPGQPLKPATHGPLPLSKVGMFQPEGSCLPP
jgi:hypothetical protein